MSADLGAGEGASLTYRISPNEIAPEEYPLKVSLALTYTLRGEELAVGFHFQNHEPELAAHLSSGCIPALPPPASKPSNSKCQLAATVAGSHLEII